MKKIRLKTLGALCLVLALAILDGCVANAQTNLQQIAEAGKGSTNWVAIPYAKYDFTTKQAGFGAAALYRNGDHLWSGLRIDRIDGEQTSAGVQAQLKADMTFAGITLHPFAESSFGIGQSSLYGSGGGGAFFTLFAHDWQRTSQPPVTLTFGLIADYEHVVYVGSKENNNNQGNAGPLIKLSF